MTNNEIWRYRGADPKPGTEFDGRLRWIVFDMDLGFGNDIAYPDSPMYATDMFRRVLGYDEFLPDQNILPVSGVSLPWPRGRAAIMLRCFFTNEAFRRDFMNTLNDMLNSSFLPDRLRSIYLNSYAIVTGRMQDHIDRWGYPVSLDYWKKEMDKIERFVLHRTDYLRQHMIDFLNSYPSMTTTGPTRLTIGVSDPQAGVVQVNEMILDDTTVGIKPFRYPWSGTYFKDIPISLTAVPRDGYQFIGWIGAEGLGTKIQVCLECDTIITAVFCRK